MGVVCTTTNKKNKQRRANSKFDRNETYKKADKIITEKIQNETNNNLNHNVTKNSNKILNVKDYKFYLETTEKNEYFIVSDFEDLKFSATFEKLYKKWEEILLFTRKQKKFSYRNLNQNHNFTINNTNQRKLSIKSNKETNINNHNHKQERYANNNNNNNIYNFNNADEANLTNFNYTKDNLGKITLGRGSLIENYISRNAESSNFIQKFQIAFYFNKYRYIKYLSKGPPNNLRWTIWLAFALCQGNHDFILEQKYLELTKKEDKNFSAFEEEQIKKDLNRSNENKEFFCNKKSLDSLYNILKALAIDDPELGYCQGMNILAANFLMISDGNEYESFNMLRFIFKHLELREFFLNGFPKLIMYLFILKEFIRENLPKLFEKILELEIPEETWIFKWLQTLYNLTLPLSISIRIIDCILCFGLEFLLNFSLAFIKCFEKKLLLCEDINDFLKTFNIEDIINPNILVNNITSSSSLNKNDANDIKINYDDFLRKNHNPKVHDHLNYFDKGNDAANISSNKKGKKDENFCFNFKSPKKENKEIQIIHKNFCMNYLKSESNTNGNSDKNENLNVKNYKDNNEKNYHNQEKRSPVSTANNNNNQIKYLINKKDELLSFREKLITNAKKIDLKEAIKQMIDNYTKENMESKNKFNDNESSTGDGLNEEKSHFYHNDNLKNNINNINNINEYKKVVPFKITYKNTDEGNQKNLYKINFLNKIEIQDNEEEIINELISEEKEGVKDNIVFYDESAKMPNIVEKLNSNATKADIQSDTNLVKTSNLNPNKLNNSNGLTDKKLLNFKHFPSSCKNIYSNKLESTNSSDKNNHEISKKEIINNENDQKSNNLSCRFKNFFLINYYNQNFDLHRFSLNSNKEFISTPRGLSIAQISLMNNIQEKLDVIRKIDGLEKDEDENDYSDLDINSNIDENFNSDIESVNRSKINRNINIAGTNIRRMSDCFCPERFLEIKAQNDYNKIGGQGRNILNSAENDNVKNLVIENDLYLENLSLGGSLYENYSDREFFETGNREEHLNINVNKTNPNLHYKTKVLNAFLIDNRSDKKKTNKYNLAEEKPNKKINVQAYLNANNQNDDKNYKKSFFDKEKKNSLKGIFLSNNNLNILNSEGLDDFNKSMDMKRKYMKSFVNDSNEKKTILNKMGIDIKEIDKNIINNSIEKKNFLLIKIDEINKSLVKINVSGDK
jgi:hypothetical protein